LHIYTGESLNNVLEQGYGSLEARVGWYPKNLMSGVNIMETHPMVLDFIVV